MYDTDVHGEGHATHTTATEESVDPVRGAAERVMESLVHPTRGVGMNLMRLCIGTSDFAPGPFYTYDDLPPGEEDQRLERFSIERDREYILPVIKAAQQRDFIRDHLGTLFRARGITTRIWVFDHNFNNPGFPATILRDPAAAAYVEGSAFHLYEGKPDVSGFHDCDPTIIVLDRDTLRPEYRADYYIYGQLMKFIEAGATRIASAGPAGAPAHVAFRNPDGHPVLVAANPGSRARALVVEWKGRAGCRKARAYLSVTCRYTEWRP